MNVAYTKIPREAWDAGDLAPFHGWNKRTPPTLSAA